MNNKNHRKIFIFRTSHFICRILQGFACSIQANFVAHPIDHQGHPITIFMPLWGCAIMNMYEEIRLHRKAQSTRTKNNSFTSRSFASTCCSFREVFSCNFAAVLSSTCTTTAPFPLNGACGVQPFAGVGALPFAGHLSDDLYIDSFSIFEK